MAGPDPAAWTRPSRADRAAGILRRAVDLARIAARGVATLATIAAGAVATAWIVWVARRPPVDVNDWTARVVVLAIGLAAPAVLVVFLLGLRELSELPRRVRELPPDLRSRVDDVRASSSSDRRVGLLGAVVRLARLVFEARETLSPYAVVSAVLRPALLVAAIVAALVAAVEIPIALVAAVVLLL